VSGVMSTQLQTVSPTDNLEIATSIMKRAQVRRLPVIDKKRQLVGVVSLADLTRAAEAEPNQRVREQYQHTIEGTLATIGRPRNGASARA